MSDIVPANRSEQDEMKRDRHDSIGAQSVSSSAPSDGSSSGSKKKSSSLPAEAVEYLKAWMMSPEHIAHPYPTEQEKVQIMADTGIGIKQLTNWFVNNRKRYWKPRVEARIQQQAHAAAAVQVQAAAAAAVVAAAAGHVAPVTPEVGFRPTLNVQPMNGFLPFDLCSQQSPEKQQTLPMLTSDFSRFMATPSVASMHAVSEASSSASVSASESDSSESSPEEDDCSSDGLYEQYDANTGMVKRSETVDVHILRPLNGDHPSISDVSVLANVPSERIVRSYEGCLVTYCYPKNDRRKVRRKIIEKVFNANPLALTLVSLNRCNLAVTLKSYESRSIFLRFTPRNRRLF